MNWENAPVIQATKEGEKYVTDRQRHWSQSLADPEPLFSSAMKMRPKADIAWGCKWGVFRLVMRSAKIGPFPPKTRRDSW